MEKPLSFSEWLFDIPRFNSLLPGDPVTKFIHKFKGELDWPMNLVLFSELEIYIHHKVWAIHRLKADAMLDDGLIAIADSARWNLFKGNFEDLWDSAPDTLAQAQYAAQLAWQDYQNYLSGTPATVRLVEAGHA